METAPRKAWIIQEMINKLEEIRKVKTTDFKECRRLNERRNLQNIVYMKEIYGEIMDLQRKERYDLMYWKAHQLGGRTNTIL